jgi:hypothetical protein
VNLIATCDLSDRLGILWDILAAWGLFATLLVVGTLARKR